MRTQATSNWEKFEPYMVENFGAEVFSEGYAIVFENRENAFEPENIQVLSEQLYEIIPDDE